MGEEVLMRLVEEIELVGPIRFDELLLEALLEDWDEVDRLVLVVGMDKLKLLGVTKLVLMEVGKAAHVCSDTLVLGMVAAILTK